MKSNYDIQLEAVLDKKKFSDDVKSLILNISYRIENSYKDFSIIKRDIKNKNDIILEIIDILEKKCNKIKIVNPEETTVKFSVNKENGLIKTYPVDNHLLHAIYFIDTNIIDEEDSLFEKVVCKMLNKGYALNGAEIIRDFNGWSWNNNIDSRLDEYYNAIYQSLLLIVGNENLKKIIKGKNVVENLKNKVTELYGERNAKYIIEALVKVALLIMISTEKNSKEWLNNYLEEKKKHLIEISNKVKYVDKIERINKKYIEEISKIDKLILNRQLLNKNYKKNKGKYSSIEEYIKHLNLLKNNRLNTITNNSIDIKPFEYMKQKKELEQELKILEMVISVYNIKEEIYYSFISFERCICNCFYKKIEIYDLKKDLINLIYEFRYFNYLIVLNKKIKDIKELELDIRNLQKNLVNKLCEQKVVDTIAKDSNLNYKILEYLFFAKMTNLNKINIKMIYNKKELVIDYYDDNVLEGQQTVYISLDDYKEIIKKMGKKIKLFIK